MPLGGQYNWATHVFMEQMLWLPVRDQINKLRKDVMGLPPGTTTQHNTAQHTPITPYIAGMTESAQSFLYTRRVPHLYCFSSAVVPKPPDWAEEIHLTGTLLFCSVILTNAHRLLVLRQLSDGLDALA